MISISSLLSGRRARDLLCKRLPEEVTLKFKFSSLNFFFLFFSEIFVFHFSNCLLLQRAKINDFFAISPPFSYLGTLLNRIAHKKNFKKTPLSTPKRSYMPSFMSGAPGRPFVWLWRQIYCLNRVGDLDKKKSIKTKRIPKIKVMVKYSRPFSGI